MKPKTRKLALAVHLIVSVGWIGAVAAYLALDLTTVTSRDPVSLRAAYIGMDTIAGRVIVPLAVASLVTGVIMSVGTSWGLFRHYWVVISLSLTILATAALLAETATISYLAGLASDPATSGSELQSLGGTLVHSVGGLLVLLGILVLNVYKPKGLTPYGFRKQQQERSQT